MRPDEADAGEIRKSGLPLLDQEKIISELLETVTLLSDRLQPILTPTEPSDKERAGEAVTTPIRSEIANTLTDNNARIRRATGRLSSVLSRLEV